MAKINHENQKVVHPANIFSIISLDAAIFGWLVAVFIIVTGFTPLSTYFPFGRIASLVLITLPGVSWLIAVLSGVIGIRKNKRDGSQKGTGLAKWGLAMSGIGCALLYGFLFLVALGFYILFSKGYIGFIHSSFASLS